MLFLDWLLQKLEPETVYAHCDIPCGIYDPHEAQVAAHTVIRMMDLMTDLAGKGLSDIEQRNSMVRYVQAKEVHAEKVKHEVRVIWADYFKPEHVKDHPNLHELTWQIMKTAGKARQTVDKKAAQDLLDQVNQFAEIFWKTKGKPSKSSKAAYPTEKQIVVPQLN